MREIRSSGSVRGGAGNDPAYSAERLGDGAAGTGGFVEAAEAGIRIGLQDPGVAGEMLLGMLAAAIARVMEENRRLALAEGAIVADISP